MSKIHYVLLKSILALSVLSGCTASGTQTAAVKTGDIVEPASEMTVDEAYKDDARTILNSIYDDSTDYEDTLKYAGSEMPSGITTVLPTYDGGTIDMSQYKGKKLLVEIVANWCQFCQKQESTNMKDLIPALGDDVSFVQMFVYGKKDDIDTFYSDAGMTISGDYPIVTESTDTMAWATATGLALLPTFLFYDETGKLSWMQEGDLTADAYAMVEPYAFGDQTRLYDLVNDGVNMDDVRRDYTAVKKDLTDDAVNAVTALSDNESIEKTVYGNIGRKISPTGTVDTLESGKTLDFGSLTGKTVYFFLMASSDVDNTDAIKAYNDFAAKHTDVNFITLLIPGAAGGATVVSDYYNSLSVKPTGYVVDADADGFPSSLYSDIILYDAPDLVFVDQTESKIMGAYIGDNTTDKYEAAFQAFLGSSPIARQTKAAASAN